MYQSFLHKMVLSVAFCLIPFFAVAAEGGKIEKNLGPYTSVSFHTDSIKYQDQDPKKKKEKTKDQAPDKKPEIATVPKARKQSRPVAVKPKVMVKPIKVIKPKIKKP